MNLFEAAGRLDQLARSVSANTTEPMVVVKAYLEEAEAMLEKDVQDNQAIGRHGADWILRQTGKTEVSVLTHCNTGSLATAGWVRRHCRWTQKLIPYINRARHWES